MENITFLDEENNLDSVTKLNTMPFFVKQYNNYLTNFPNSNLIFIDFAKLKRINDEFTHKGGNDCLSSFGTIIKTVFSDSLTVRKHGDEFLILTKNSFDEICKKFDKTKEYIQNHFDLSLIPVLYDFNAGVVQAEHGIDPTIEKADIMMYEAKKRGLTYLNYNQEMYEKVKKDQQFIKETSQAIDNNNLTLARRTLYKADKTATNIYDIHTRNVNRESLFTENRLKLLEESSELKKLDYLNLKQIILSSNIPYGNKILINIHANSLFNARTPFPRFINALFSTMIGDPKNYIICINVSNFSNNTEELIIYLNLLKEMNFEIALSSLDLHNNNPLINIWPKIDAKFIKINSSLWKNAQQNNKYNSLLKYFVPAFLENGTIPIFMKVENEQDLEFIKNISSNSLIEGNIVDTEEEINFKKTL